MGQSTDQIRQEIDQKRDDAASKIDQLQTQVQDSADAMRSNVQDTAEQLRDQVKGTVEDTIDTVKQNVDFRQQIEERPLMALGMALVGGFLLGGLTSGGSHQSGSGQFSQAYQPSTGHAGQSNTSHSGSNAGSSMGNGLRSALQKTGLEETFSNAAAAMLGSVTDQLKATLDQNFPGFAGKMQTAEEKPGGFTEKARETQSTTKQV